jgi:2-methylcitrate dehydratase PrpD
LKELCHFVAARRFDEFPAATVAHARRVIMDTLGVILGGSKDAPLEKLANLLGPSTNQRVSTRLGTPREAFFDARRTPKRSSRLHPGVRGRK